MENPQPKQQACGDDADFQGVVAEYIRAGYQCLFVPTTEEARLEGELQKMTRRADWTLISWSASQGFSGPPALVSPKYNSVHDALRVLATDSPFSGDAVFLFKDLAEFFPDLMVRRLIRTMCEGNQLVNQRHKRPLIISSPSDTIHDSLKPCVTIVDFALPNEPMLRRILDFVQASIAKDTAAGRQTTFTEEFADQVVACLRGLTGTEAENVMARCLVRHKGFEPQMLETIKAEKAQIIRKSEMLTFIPEGSQARREEIGGFDLLMEWVDRRRLAYGRKAQEVNLDYPKGVVLLGVPGTGKSYVAMGLGRLLGLPVYILDIGAVFGHLVGQSESRMRTAIKLVEAQQGCILLLDEADKAFGGAADSSQDSGVTRRVFGQFLTWLANKQDRTFVVMTLNRTKGIPPELLRAGRFDAVFFTDLPHADERRQILDIHFRKRGVNPESLGLGDDDWSQLVKRTQDFVGSELEEIVREARYIAFERRESGVPNFDEIMEAQAGIRPISILDSENVSAIRDFCRDRARPVSSPPKRRQARTRNVDLT